MNAKEHSVSVYIRHGNRPVTCVVPHGARLSDVLAKIGYPKGEQVWRFMIGDHVIPMDYAVNGDIYQLELVHVFSGLPQMSVSAGTACT